MIERAPGNNRNPYPVAHSGITGRSSAWSVITTRRYRRSKRPLAAIKPFPRPLQRNIHRRRKLRSPILGREVPSGGLPIDAGAIVHNIGTAEAVQKAVVLGQPLIERVVTVSGEAIAHPKNLLARIGTPIGLLIEHCGGITQEKAALIAGGPMMGIPLESLDCPTKVAGCYSAPAPCPIQKRSCASNGCCFTVYPLGLNPAELSELGDQGFISEAVRLGVTDCCSCGLCTTICPAGRKNAENQDKGSGVARETTEHAAIQVRSISMSISIPRVSCGK
jgi:Na+-translocating ferredoxin:NAD+ oxidoreductase RnfC subunit